MIAGFRDYYSGLLSNMDIEDLGNEICLLIHIEDHIPFWKETSMKEQLITMKECLIDEAFVRLINGTVDRITV